MGVCVFFKEYVDRVDAVMVVIVR